MAATTTPDLEHALGKAFTDLNEANQAVQKASNALDTAQQAAQNGVQLQQDAQSESKSAEARYTVLVAKSGELLPPEIVRLRDEHTKLQSDLLGIDREIQQAHEDERNESQAKRALEEFSAVAQEWMTSAADAVSVIRGCAVMMEEARPGPHSAARISTVSDRLSECHVSFSEQIEAVMSFHGRMHAALAALSLTSSRQEHLPGLIAERQIKEEELTRVRSTLAEKHQTVDPVLVRHVTEEHAVAEQAAREAPNVMQRARAAASESAAQLASAQEWQKQARENLDNVESQIITAIDVSKPNAAGWVKATAHLTQQLSPLLYKLSWGAGGADVRKVQQTDETGLTQTVLIDTNMLPLGDTTVTASIEQVTKP
jgi:hypothetical protein